MAGMKIGTLSVPPSGQGGSRPPRESLEAAMMLSEEERRAATRAVVEALRDAGPLSREEILSGLELAHGVWEAEPPGASRSRALKGLLADRQRMEGPDLPAITNHLVCSLEARHGRHKLFSKLGLGLALGGFFAAMSGHPVAAPLGLGLGVVGAGCAAWFGLARHRAPEQDNLIRLATYARVAVEQQAQRKRFEEMAEETRQMVAALGDKARPQIRPTEDGIMVGSVFLPRKGA